MSTDIEEQKKLLLPLLQVRKTHCFQVPQQIHLTPCVLEQRAEEIQAVQPKVAYYCRLYALEQVGVILRPDDAFRILL
jgi:hypothetical protein